jgi:hypothetical protein
MEATMRKLGIPLAACLLTAIGAAPIASAAPAVKVGTVSGTLTTQGGAALNGMCVNLYKGNYKGAVTTTAPTGSTGTAGFFTQGNVAVGTYLALFFNCGANVAGTPDPNYETIFYANTYTPSAATKFTVTAGATTNLGRNPIPLGGAVTGTVTDLTTGSGADAIPVGIQIPGASSLNLTSGQGWYIACSDSSGHYTINGVPTGGVRVVFAPDSWGCFPGGVFNAGKWVQKKSAVIDTTPDVTTTVNGKVTEA